MSRILMPSALAMAIFSISNAQAADANTTVQQDQQLPVIVITASKTPEAIEKVPARISVIDEKTIQQSAVSDLPHLLQQEAALNVVQLGGFGQQTSIFTRGTESNHTLVLQDGVSLNTGSQSAANINFADLTNVSRIEVLKGPASVQYGSDAIGGVVQLISSPPKKQRFFTTVEGGEQNTYKAIVGADLVQEDAYFQVRGQRLETDGSPVSNAPNAKDASYDQKGYSVKGGIENDQYAASAEIKENKGTSQYDSFGSRNAQDFNNRLINLKGNVNFSEQVKLNIRLSQFEDQLTQNNANYLKQIDYTNSDRQEADANLQWQFTPSQNVLIGATRRSTDVDSLSYGTKYDKSLDTSGYYLQHQYQDDNFSTQAGVRLEDNKQFGSHTVGQFAVRYFVAPTTSIYTNIGSAFKAPSGDDLYGYGGNPDLDPETSVSYEVGFDHQITQSLSTYFSAYRTKIKDLIDSVCKTNCQSSNPYDDIYQNVNINKAELTGTEIGLKWKSDNWFASTELAYVKPKNVAENEDLSRRPRKSATLSIGWDNGTYGINSSITAKSRSDNSGFDNTKIPGHVSASLNAYWQYNPHIKVFTNIQNLSDTNYKTAYGSGAYYTAADRLATAGITLSY